MALTEADWKARMLDKAEKLAPQRTINEAYLRQAAVDAELLTGHPGWDIYLQRLQVWLDEAKQNLASWQEKITTAYDDAQLRMVQIQVAIWQNQICIVKECMQLPKEILAHAQETLEK